MGSFKLGKSSVFKQRFLRWAFMIRSKRSLLGIAMATIVIAALGAVCVSTSASGAVSSNASVKASPNLVGNPIPASTGPSECIPTDYHYLYLFVQGYDGALWYNQENLTGTNLPNWGWSGWTSLGKPSTGNLTSSPCAISRQTGVIDVYVRGTDGAVWERSFSSGTWHGWYEVGGQVAAGTGPGASGWSGREDVFIEGTDGAMHQTTWTSSSGWSSGWVNLGGHLTSSPGAVSRSSGIISVYVRGTDGAVWERPYSSEAWQGWYNLGGVLAPGTGPAVSAWQYYQGSRLVNREDVFVVGTNGAMYQKTWTAGSGWTTTWANLGGKLTSSPSAATMQYSIEIFARGTDGYLYLKEYFSGGWHAWSGGSMQGPPGAL